MYAPRTAATSTVRSHRDNQQQRTDRRAALERGVVVPSNCTNSPGKRGGSSLGGPSAGAA